MKKKLLGMGLAFLLLFAGCHRVTEGGSELPPSPVIEGEVRGMWLSYLELDDGLRGKTVREAKNYIDRVMERLAADGFNTVFFHVRAHGDAYYASEVFPAADSVQPLLEQEFDPLQYAVTAAHREGLQLHAWINPYRIGEDRTRAVCEDVFELNGCWYYIPTAVTAQRCILDGVRELVHNYAIDGVQYDDYFYPAGLNDTPMSFEGPAGTLTAKEWRTAGVNALVSATYAAVHQRENCVFGVSPAVSIERNRDTLYADVARWLKTAGYIDYLCPQLYVGFENEAAPFTDMLDAYLSLPRLEGIRLYAGLSLYKCGVADTYAGTGRGEWTENKDILVRQAKAAADKGFAGIALFRYAYWETPQNDMAAAEISSLKTYFYKS